MIRNIVFDMGGVLIRWCPDEFMEILGIPEEDRETLRKGVYDTIEWHQMDRGTLSMEDGVSILLSRLPERLRETGRYLALHWYEKCLLPMEGMEALIRELKDKGYGIYLLSNAKTDLYQYFDRIPGSQYFDGKLVSADWKLLKPQHEIFETLFREFHLKPEECFFVDDMVANAEGARYAGMDSAVFDGDISRLRKALSASGVPVA